MSQIKRTIFEHKTREKSFTLVELLIVIAIIALLASIVLVSTFGARERAYFGRTQGEMRSMAEALNLYFLDYDYGYPCDVNRAVPPGLQTYLTSNPEWPKAPWPESVYDYDYWSPDSAFTGPWHGDLGVTHPDNCAGQLTTDGNPAHDKPVYQISVRFCPMGGPLSACRFPRDSWASDFDVNSSVYYCIEGPCRAHGSESFDYPSCCIGGACPAGARLCE